MRMKLAAAALALPLFVLAQPVVASGSGGGGGGGFSGGFGGGASVARDPAAEAYSRGKSMVSKRIACKKCAFPEGVKDTPTARDVAARVRAGEFALKPAERDQVLYYLSQRFGA